MSGSQGLRRLWRHPTVVAAAVIVFASSLVAAGGTLASFSAQTGNGTSTLAGGWLAPATNLTVAPSGLDGQLVWTPGRHGPDGQQLYGVDNGASSTCPASGYTLLATMASASTTSYTDGSTSLANPRSAIDGHYVCYQMVGTRSGSSWTATGSFPATRLGLVATAATIANGGSSGAVDAGDTVTLTFNQQTNVSASSGLLVCTFTSGVVLLGDTAGACNAATDGYSIAKLTLGSGSVSQARTESGTVSVTSSAPWQVTLTVTGNRSASLTSPGSWTVTPSNSILSAATTDQAAACTSATYNCTPTAGGGF